MHFIGDLSENDATQLALRAIEARAGILEFGSGGSTQLLAAHSRPTVPMRSVDTDPLWIQKTQANLQRLGILRKSPVEFRQWLPLAAPLERKAHEAELVDGEWDLVLVDGLRDMRKHFARIAWRKLAVGG